MPRPSTTTTRRTRTTATVATAVFTTPELGTVGLTEEEARQAFPAVDIYKTRFRPLKHTLTTREETVFMKLAVDRASGRVVGCHMVGRWRGRGRAATGGSRSRAGATKAQFDATMAVHPTAAEEFVTMYEPVAEDRCRRAQLAPSARAAPADAAAKQENAGTTDGSGV